MLTFLSGTKKKMDTSMIFNLHGTIGIPEEKGIRKHNLKVIVGHDYNLSSVCRVTLNVPSHLWN